MSPIGNPQIPPPPPGPAVARLRSDDRRRWPRRRRAPAALGLLLLALLLAASEPRAQVVFGSQISGGGGPVTGLFEARNGAVTVIATGLPTNEFASLSPDGRLIVASSPDPQQPQEASWDLFAFDRATGQRRRLVNNVTQEQPDGSFNFASPLFSATEATNQRVAFVNQLSSSNNQQQGGSVRVLQVLRASDGFLLSTAEIGNGNAIDFYQSEFVGLSWRRDAPAFAAPAYVDVVSNMGRPTVNAALVLFAQQGAAGEFVRVAQLTAPRVFDQPGQIIAETDAWPAFSPDGQRLAWFRITYPDPLMTQPASMQLMLGPAGGTATPTLLVQFNPGFLPLGLAWSADSSALVFSLANQTASGGQFPPTAEPSTAILRTFDLQSGAIGTVAGAPVGYFPSVAPPSPAIFASGFE